jgi:HK97 family phage major capsid protein
MSNPVLEAGDKLARARSRAEAIIETTKRERRGFNGNERTELDGCEREMRAAQGDIERLALQGERSVGPSGRIGLTDNEVERFSLCKAILNSAEGRFAGTFEDEVSRATAKRLGKSPKGFMIPEDITRRETRTTGGATQLVGTTGLGGYLVATDMRGDSLIDLLRNRLVCEALGATTMTGLVGNVAIPTITGDPTVTWVAEDTDATLSHFSVGQLTLTPHDLAAAVAISRKLLLQSSVDCEQFVRRELASVLAVEIDRAALCGTGTLEPFGILHTTGVNTQAMSSSTNANSYPTWATLLGFIGEVAADNADVASMGWAINPAAWAYMAGAVKVTTAQGGFLLDGWPAAGGLPGATIAGFRALISNQVPANLSVKAASASAIIFGAWSNLILAYWSGCDIIVDPYSQSLSGTVRVVAHQDVDFGIRHPQGFCVSTDVKTS